MRACTKENNICFDLRRVAKRLKTCVRWRANLSSIKVVADHRQPSQVHASRGQTESQVTPSFHLAITCDSVWPGLDGSLARLLAWDKLNELNFKSE